MNEAIRELKEVLIDNSINISIDRNITDEGDEVLFVDFGEEPIRVDGDILSTLKHLFNGENTEIVFDEDDRLAKIWLETSEVEKS